MVVSMCEECTADVHTNIHTNVHRPSDPGRNRAVSRRGRKQGIPAQQPLRRSCGHCCGHSEKNCAGGTRPVKVGGAEGPTCGPRALRGRKRTATQWIWPAPRGRPGCAYVGVGSEVLTARIGPMGRGGGLSAPRCTCVHRFTGLQISRFGGLQTSPNRDREALCG